MMLFIGELMQQGMKHLFLRHSIFMCNFDKIFGVKLI